MHYNPAEVHYDMTGPEAENVCIPDEVINGFRMFVLKYETPALTSLGDGPKECSKTKS